MTTIAENIDERIRQLWQAQLGNIEFMGVNPDGLVTVKLRGACAACPTAQRILINSIKTELIAVQTKITDVIVECEVA